MSKGTVGSRGGILSLLGVPPAPKTLADAVDYFAWIAHAVTTGKIDARTGHEAAYALNGFKAALVAREQAEEIQALRAQIAALQSRPGKIA